MYFLNTIQVVYCICIKLNTLKHFKFYVTGTDPTTFVKAMGSQENAYRAIEQAAQSVVSQQGLTGNFKSLPIKVVSQYMNVGGTVMNGKFRLGTAFIPD